MSHNITLNELVERLVSSNVNKLFVDVDFFVTEAPINTDSLSVDDLANRVFSNEMNQAFPQIDFEAEEIGAGLEITELRVYMHAKRFSFTVFMITLTCLGMLFTLLTFLMQTFL